VIIYKVTNLVNNKIYIGKTVKKLNRRKKEHMVDSRGKKYNSVFHAAIRKYGPGNFCWEVLDEVMFSDLLLDLERFYIKKYRSMVPFGYNICSGGEGLGHPCSEENKRKMSLAKRGVPRSEETKERMSISNTGRIVTEQTRKKISLSMMGKHKSETAVANMVIARRARIVKEVVQ